MRVFNNVSPIIYGLDGKVEQVIELLWVSEAQDIIFFPIMPRMHVGGFSEADEIPSESPEYAVAVFRKVPDSIDDQLYFRYTHTEYIIPEGYPDPLPPILSVRIEHVDYSSYKKRYVQ